VNDIDALIRDRLTAAATFDVVTEPRRVHESVARRQRQIDVGAEEPALSACSR